MIVRISGEGQWELPDDALPEFNELDRQIESAVRAQDATGLGLALRELDARVRRQGVAIGDDDLRDSDLIIPGPDSSLQDVATMLASDDRPDGLFPG